MAKPPAHAKRKGCAPVDDGLWRRYLADRGQVALRDWLVARHLHLADAAVARARHRLPAHVDPDPLLSAAYEALVGCVERYDPSLRVPFAAFTGRRLRGAIADAIRQSTGCRLKTPPPATSSLYEPVATDGRDNGRVLRVIDTLTAKPAADGQAASRRAADELARLARGMPIEEQVILYLYYICRSSMKAIAQVMGRSESWVSQLHARAVERIRRLHGCCETLSPEPKPK